MHDLITPEERSELLSALERAYQSSPFWRARLESVGITRADIVTDLDFSRLPLLSKLDLLVDQAGTPPFGSLLAIDPRKISRVHKTSGTSAIPFFIALTDQDIADTNLAAQRAFKAAGLQPGERVVHCLNFNMWSGGVTDYLGLESAGATGIPFGVGNSSSLLQVLRTLDITSISATPSYMFVIAERCRAELGIEPRELGLRKGYFGGEGILQMPGVRERIEQDFGMLAMDANYGMSEVLSIIGGEGAERDGLHWHAHGILHAELVDEHGASVSIEPGARGELVFSTLRREAQPLFRYRSNDLAEIISVDVPDDGLPRFRFRILGRMDDMLVIRGVNFFPQSILPLLPTEDAEVSSVYAVVRPQQPREETLQVLIESAITDPARLAQKAEIVQDRVYRLLHVRIAITWLPSGSLQRGDNKTRYLIEPVAAAAAQRGGA